MASTTHWLLNSNEIRAMGATAPPAMITIRRVVMARKISGDPFPLVGPGLPGIDGRKAEFGVDLLLQVPSRGGVRPSPRVSAVEFDRLPLVFVPVVDAGVALRATPVERGGVVLLRLGAVAVLLRRPHRGGLAEPGEQVVADVRAQEGHVVIGLHLVADDADG